MAEQDLDRNDPATPCKLEKACKKGQVVKGPDLVCAAVLSATVLALAAAGWWLLQPAYRVLFADLRPQDKATIAQELDKGKLPYRIGDDGASILVEQSQVHAIRVKLMGGEMGLHGSVGLELCNTSDFGMTEFAQKINYLDAAQQEQLRRLLVAAVGASLERGDTVVVQALAALLPAATEQKVSAPEAPGPTSALPPRPQTWQPPPYSQWLVPALLGAAGVVGLFGAVWIARREWRRIDRRALADAPAAAREEVPDQVSPWMRAGKGPDDAGARPSVQDNQR